ncbi:MAG: right-handed parallel beta-helix repeat-containing protein [Phycisphaeraceae bacterium]
MNNSHLTYALLLVAGLVLSGAADAFAGPHELANPAPLPAFETAGRSLSEAGLESGVLRAGEVEFQVDPQAVAVIDGSDRETRTLVAAEEPFKASHLSFLQTFQPGEGIENYRVAEGLAKRTLELPPDRPILYNYEVHYADGETLDIPVRWGESVREWYRLHVAPPLLWAQDTRAVELSDDGRELAVLYAMSWPNPRPEVAIREIRVRPGYESWIDYGDAAVLGVSSTQKPATGRYLYVDPGAGKDRQPGTFDAPFRSIQKAFDEVQPGDTIFLRGGFYALSRMAELVGKGGEPGRWITLTNYPGETPIIDGEGVRYDPNQAQFDQDDPTGPSFQRDLGVIAVYDIPTGYVRIQGLTVQNSLRCAISAHGRYKWADREGTDRPRGLDVSFNTTYQIREIGVNLKFWDEVTSNSNVIVRPHSERMVFHVHGDERDDADFPRDLQMNMAHHGQEALDLTENSDFVVNDNEVYGGSKEAIDLISVADGEVAYNYVGHSLNGIYIDSWGLPIRNLKVYRNFGYEVFTGIPCSTEGSNNLIGFDIYENIIVDSHSEGIAISEATYKAQPAEIYDHAVYNNTIVSPGYHADAIEWTSSGIRISGFADNPNVRDITVFNNIVTDAAHTPYMVSFENPGERNIAFEHNLAWPGEDRLPEYLEREDQVREVPPMEEYITKDPQFVAPERGDFRLREDSPARGTGRDGGDLGALPYGAPWIPGLDFAGHVTPYYRGELAWEPVYIPGSKFNTFRNNIQRPRFFQEGRYGADLQPLDSGAQVLDGVVYHVEQEGRSLQGSVITLAGYQSEAEDEHVTGIPVGRRADRLAFLHTAHLRPEKRGEAVEIARYVVNYADGSEVAIPVVNGENITHWYAGKPNDLPQADVAWTIPTTRDTGGIHGWSTLYSVQWQNPHPEKEIASIDLMRSSEPRTGNIALFAISAGER